MDSKQEYIQVNKILPEVVKIVWLNNDIQSLNTFYHSLEPSSDKNNTLKFFNEYLPNRYGKDINNKRIKKFGKRISKDNTIKAQERFNRFLSLDDTGNKNTVERYFGGDMNLWLKTKKNIITYEEKLIGTKSITNTHKFNSLCELKVSAKPGGSPTGVKGCKSYRGLK
jgi:hypothetical protein